jgi:hypothetical protein
MEYAIHVWIGLRRHIVSLQPEIGKAAHCGGFSVCEQFSDNMKPFAAHVGFIVDEHMSGAMVL